MTIREDFFEMIVSSDVDEEGSLCESKFKVYLERIMISKYGKGENLFIKCLIAMKSLLAKIRPTFKPLEKHNSIFLFIESFCVLNAKDELSIVEISNLIFPTNTYFIFKEEGSYEGIYDTEPNNSYLYGLDEISQYLKYKTFKYFSNAIILLINSWREASEEAENSKIKNWVNLIFYDIIHS